MQPSDDFRNLAPNFWAYVKLIGQEVGYTKEKQVIVPTKEQIEDVFQELGLSSDELFPGGQASPLWNKLLEYFNYRADVLNNQVEPLLMNAEEAEEMYNRLKEEIVIPATDFPPPIAMNKQKGEKKKPAFFTCMINLLVARELGFAQCDYDPRKLACFASNGHPIRTFSRRLDGAFPGVLNPQAVWEIKEYYYTTTFGSRVADGVYETLLDGTEFQEMLSAENRKCYHYLFVDAKYTWWDCGKSYLCRLVDMMHMGFVDEVIFGREIEQRIPAIVSNWH